MSLGSVGTHGRRGGRDPDVPPIAPRVTSAKKQSPNTARAPCSNDIFARFQILTFDPVFQVLLCGCSESSRFAQRQPKVFRRYIGVGHGVCDSLARSSGKKIVPRVQHATHFSARRSVEHALLLAY